MMESVWTDAPGRPEFPTLSGDLTTDVLVIGGGMAGVLCADCLQRAGVRTILVEADRIGNGITKNTTAKITSQHGLIYDRLIRRFGPEKAQMYFCANEAAAARYRTLCADLDCDWEKKPSYVYSRTQRKILEREIRAIETIGGNASYRETLPLPFPTAGAVAFPNAAQFHPLKFLFALAKDLPIYENTRVELLSGHTAVTNRGKITAKKVIIATHFPFLNRHGSYFLKLYQQRSYVMALEGARNVKGMYLDAAKNGLSFRNYGKLLLVGGGGHRTGKKGGGWSALSEFAKLYFPQAQVRCRFATQDCMTLDAVPYIGAYSASTPDWYVATGFQKWGMTTSMAAAMILTDLVLEKENLYAAVFSPSRSIIRPQLARNAYEATVNLLTPFHKRCPHMGCALRWNPQERSWDCPCHGSRFAKDGALLDNPATGDLPKTK